MEIGMNLSPVNDYNREWVFQNIFKQSREWRLVKGNVVQPPSVQVPVLPNGYPDFSQIAPEDLVQSLMLIDQDGKYPKGAYTASWKGDATGVIFRGQAVSVLSVTKTNDRWNAVIDVQGDKGIILELNHVNVEDMVVLMPGESDNRIFHSKFVSPLRGVRFIRFLNWMNTNSVRQPHTWAGRTTPQSPRQSYQPQGVALEYMVGLCNQTGTNPWFCMPHLADDNYVLEFAKYVKRTFKGQKIYVEFSNETWNSIFPVNAWAQAQAQAQGIIWPYVIADAAKHMWSIWQSVFSDTPNKIVRVVGGHIVNKWVAAKVLERLGGDADMVAVANYLAIPRSVAVTFNETTTAAQVLTAARDSLLTLTRGLEDHKTLGKPVGVYEGGQGIVGDTKWMQAAWDAQTLPEMYRATLDNITNAESRGAVCFGVFSFVSKQESQHGSWGHAAYQEQLFEPNLKQKAPKAAAVRDYLLR